VVFGLRPEDVQDSLTLADPDPARTVEVKIEVLGADGSRTYLYLGTGATSFIARVRPTGRFEVNRRMKVTFDVDKAHLFDAGHRAGAEIGFPPRKSWLSVLSYRFSVAAFKSGIRAASRATKLRIGLTTDERRWTRMIELGRPTARMFAAGSYFPNSIRICVHLWFKSVPGPSSSRYFTPPRG